MTDDVRAALGRWRSGDYSEDEAAVDQVHKDTRTLAAAFAAEHPADEERHDLPRAEDQR